VVRKLEEMEGSSGVTGARYQAQTSTSDDDLLDITHAGGSTSDGRIEGENGDISGLVEEIPGLGQYDDFHTIDWQRDIARDRTRHRYIVKKKQDGFLDLIRGAHDAWSGWVCVLLVGLMSGVVVK